MKTSCGVIAMPQEVEVDRTEGRLHSLGIRVGDHDVFAGRLLVDNRKGDAFTLQLGTRAIAIAAGKLEDIALPHLIASCATVARGGVALATIPAPPPEVNGWRARQDLLVDPTGKRCYQLRSVYYDNFAYGERPKPFRAVIGPGTAHLLPHAADFVFKRAPNKLQLDVPAAKKYELTDASCPQRSPKP